MQIALLYSFPTDSRIRRPDSKIIFPPPPLKKKVHSKHLRISSFQDIHALLHIFYEFSSYLLRVCRVSGLSCSVRGCLSHHVESYASNPIRYARSMFPNTHCVYKSFHVYLYKQKQHFSNHFIS